LKAIAATAVLALSLGGAAAAAPEDAGSLPVTKHTFTVAVGVDPRSPEGLVPLMQVDVYAPALPGRRPVVEISHGLCNTKADFAGWGKLLASRGFVVVIPTRRGAVESILLNDLGDQQGEYIPGAGPLPLNGTVSGTCTNFDQRVNPEDLLRLLRWTIAQGRRPSGFLSGKVDPSRLALMGHSEGGLFVAQAAAISQAEGPRLSAIVLLDNGDHVPFAPPGTKTARQLAATLDQPTAILASQETQPPLLCDIRSGGICQLSANETFAALPAQLPRLGLRVNGALHGEVEDPDNDDQALANPARQLLFRRYAMAWLECWLQRDSSARPYLNGSASGLDAQAGRITLMPGTPDTALSARGCP
jgi:pimeloyl-ACP methyl ester carboxylesterase